MSLKVFLLLGRLLTGMQESALHLLIVHVHIVGKEETKHKTSIDKNRGKSAS